MKIDAQTKKIGLYLIGGYAAYKLILAPILEALNIKDTKAEVEAEKLKTNTENATLIKDYWRPAFWLSRPAGYKAYILTAEQSKNLVDALASAKGTFNDDEEKIYAVFRGLKYQSQVSYLAQRFSELKQKDLYTWLRDSVLNEKELNTVLQITSKLPTGFFK